MPRLIAFTFVTLDGYFDGPNRDTSWNRQGEEEGEYAVRSVEVGNTLLFGRITYEHMVAFWPTDMAKGFNPRLAAGMNAAEKVVFSRSMTRADWNNTRVASGDVAEEVRSLKKRNGKDIAIMGSGSLVTQLTDLGLIDEYQLMINPIAIGNGVPIFKGIKNLLELRLTKSKVFKSGVILATYEKKEP